MTTQGKVTLVGAGPGDPELLTLKAVKAIQSRHRAAGRRPRRSRHRGLAAPGARIVHVGKRGGCKSTPQAFIER
jgi:uroporphyrin-III C-methyltransferase